MKYPGGYSIPYVIVDSGNQVLQGSVIYNDYKALVDLELDRAPNALIEAYSWRVGDHLEFEVTITNQVGVTLSKTANNATVFVLVYEDVPAPPPEGTEPTLSVTSRLVREVPILPVDTPLANNATATYRLSTGDLTGVDWSKLHAVASIDYRPLGTTGAYDMLQASVAVEPVLTVDPCILNFTIGPDDTTDPEANVQITGAPLAMPWQVTSKPDWVTVEPGTGYPGATAVVRVHIDALQPGKNSGVIVISTMYSPVKTQEISIQASYTPPSVFTVFPTAAYFVVDRDAPKDQTQTLSFSGYPPDLHWVVTAKPDWLEISHSSGSVGTTEQITVYYSRLQVGENTGEITFTAAAPEGDIVQTIEVGAVYDRVWFYYIPLLKRN